MKTKTPEDFLAGVESKAFRIAEIAIENAVDAMEILQNTTIQWVRKFSRQADYTWTATFYKALYAEIVRFQSEQKKLPRAAVISEFDEVAGKGSASDLFDANVFNERVYSELTRLSLRQQQVFLLSEWLKLDAGTIAEITDETIDALESHHARAVLTLKNALREME